MKLIIRSTTILVIVMIITMICKTDTSYAQIVRLQIGNKILVADIVTTRNKMVIGLSKTEHLLNNEGMFFVFPFTDFHCMTMKDTKIPLSLIYLDDNLNVIESTNMEAMSNINYCASKPAAYAIEAKYNWFNKTPNNTKVVILK